MGDTEVPAAPADGAGSGTATRDGRRRRRWLRWLAWGVVALVVAIALVVVWWVLSYPEAAPGPLEVVRIDPAVTVVEGDRTVSLHPAEGPGDTAVVFYPGAAVPPEAYLATWAPIVAEAGVSVYVPAMPLRLAILASGRADAVIADHPEVTTWWVGGHSLGGAMAAGYAGRSDPGALAGLVLWGAYATEGAALAERDDLVVLSVGGSEDGLPTPTDIADRRDLLPSSTTFVELDGVTHAQFGAYGEQRGDGVARVDDEEARRAIADAVVPVLLGTG
jgi:hypothetical protein